MPAKKKAVKTDPNLISITKDDYEQLLQMAEQQAQSTDDVGDNEYIENLKSSVEEGIPLETTDNSRWELDETSVLTSIKHALKREELCADGRWRAPTVYNPLTKKREPIKPMLNQIGISDIITILSGMLTKDIAMGNITKDEAHSITINVTKSLIWEMVYNHKKWGMDKSYRHKILAIIENKLFLHLTRPVGEGERNYRRNKYQMRETFGHDEIRPDEIYGPQSMSMDDGNYPNVPSQQPRRVFGMRI